VLPMLCPKCGGAMKIIAFITETAVMKAIPGHLDEPTSPPRLQPARGPPLWEMAHALQDESDPQAQPAPDYEFDQRIAWWGKRRTDSLVGGYSCLWPPERQTSAAQVATCTDNGSAGAAFSGAVRKNRHEIHDLHRRERARYFEKRHWNSCASMSFWNAGGKLKHSVLFASFPKLLGDGRSRARARRLQDFGVVHTLPDRPTQEDVSRNQKTPSPLPRER